MQFRLSATALMATLLAASVSAQSGVVDADPQQPTQSPAEGVPLHSFNALGCFSNPGEMWDMGPYTYQTTGWCQPLCVRQQASYFALVNGTNCFCGTSAPSSSKKVSSSECDTSCSGFDAQDCGGINRWAIYSSGFRSGDDTGSISITTPTQTWFGHDATGNPSTLKTITGPNTVYVTASGAAAAATAAQTVEASSGPNKAAIAAGVVVGVVVLVAVAIGGAFFARRHKKNRELEEERRRHDSIMRIVNNKGEKPPSFSEASDSRIDPGVMFQRRQSNGSIMEDQDYSRRILTVTNPDHRSSGIPPRHY